MIIELLQRPIAFHPVLVSVTKSVNAAVMLSQALYWTKRTQEKDGWFYKSRDEWMDETGLSHEEQATARKRLIASGVWEEHSERLLHRTWFRVKTDVLESMLLSRQTVNDTSPNRETRLPQTVNHGLGNKANPVSSNGTETTFIDYSDITTPKTRQAAGVGFSLETEQAKLTKKEKRERFKPPTFEEAQDYGKEIGLTDGQAAYVFDHYEAKGWKMGKTPMSDWKAAWRGAQRGWDFGKVDEKAKETQYDVTPEQMAEWTQNRIDNEREREERAAAKARGETWEEKNDF